jgi:HlyD family secretion protein
MNLTPDLNWARGQGWGLPGLGADRTRIPTVMFAHLGSRERRWLAVASLLVVALGAFVYVLNRPAAESEGRGAGTSPTSPLPEIVAAEGLVLPRRRAELAFGQSGQVAAVRVEEGQRVASGTALVQLDDGEARAAVAAAEARLAAAEAKLAELEAGPRSEDVAVAAAELAKVRAGSRPEAIAAARSALDKAAAALQQAKDAYEPIRWLPDISRRPESLALEAATADHARAQAEYDAAVAGASAEELRLAEARYRQVAARATGPELASARAEVARARADLDAARQDLAGTVLVAPFDGVAAQVNVRAAERVAAGAKAVVFGDPDTLEVETQDLSEVDVARVAAGQPVTITAEAWPGRTFGATVRQVSPIAVDRRGERVFPVRLALDEAGREALRWGMTVFVDIGTGPPPTP